jgi:hypothetical protein
MRQKILLKMANVIGTIFLALFTTFQQLLLFVLSPRNLPKFSKILIRQI